MQFSVPFAFLTGEATPPNTPRATSSVSKAEWVWDLWMEGQPGCLINHFTAKLPGSEPSPECFRSIEPELEEHKAEHNGASCFGICWNQGLSKSTLGLSFHENNKQKKTLYTTNFDDPTHDLLARLSSHFPEGISRNSPDLWGNALRIYTPK